MARALKILAQAELGTSSATVYTVPTGLMTSFGSRDLYSAVVSSLVLCNRNAATKYFTVQVVPNGETPANKHIIFNERNLTTDSTDVISLGMGLLAGDKIDMLAEATSSISVTIFGIESS